MSQIECHFPTLKSIAEGNAEMPHNPIKLRIKWLLMRHLSLHQFESFYKRYHTVRSLFTRLRGKPVPSTKPGRHC